MVLCKPTELLGKLKNKNEGLSLPKAQWGTEKEHLLTGLVFRCKPKSSFLPSNQKQANGE